MNSHHFLRFRRFLPPLAFATLLGSCASPPEIPSSPANGLKEYTVEVRRSSTLIEGPSQGKVIDFWARCVSMSPDGLTAELELKPTYGGHPLGMYGQDELATQRVSPVTTDGGNVISVTSRKFAGIPLESLGSLSAEIDVSGPNKGSVRGICFHVSSENLVKCIKTSSGKYLTTFRKGGSTFTMTIDDLKNVTSEAKFRPKDPEWWGTDAGTQVCLRHNEWSACRLGLGPDGADFSFLETKSTRGEFD